MNIIINQTLLAGTSVSIDVDFDWDDVEEWYVKWDTLHYKLRSEPEFREIELNSQNPDCVGWCWPYSVTILDEHRDLLAESLS